MADNTHRNPPYHTVLFGALSTPGVVLGAVLLWVSFGSSLLPRDPMMQGFSASCGHGHNYNNVFADGWSVVAPPAGWTDAETLRLETYVSSLDLSGS